MNEKKLILGLTGYAGSGKDSVADYLVTNYGFQKLSISWSLKLICADLFDVDLKCLSNNDYKDNAVDVFGCKVLPRTILQKFGTDIMRNIGAFIPELAPIQDKIWILKLKESIKKSKFTKFVISDIRFINETEICSHVWKIVNSDKPRTSEHISEMECDKITFDNIIISRKWMGNQELKDLFYSKIDEGIGDLLEVWNGSC